MNLFFIYNCKDKAKCTILFVQIETDDSVAFKRKYIPFLNMVNNTFDCIDLYVKNSFELFRSVSLFRNLRSTL